jgi:hypothetical protein
MHGANITGDAGGSNFLLNVSTLPKYTKSHPKNIIILRTTGFIL